MIARIVHLSANDDASSVPDLLEWAGAQRVLLNVPPDSVLRAEIDFSQIRRAADRFGCEVAVVSTRRGHRVAAEHAGLAAFSSVTDAARHDWDVEGAEPIRRRTPPRRFQPNSLARVFPKRNWLGIAASVVFTLLTVAVGGLTVLAIVPEATVTLGAARQDYSVIVPVLLDVTARRPNTALRIVPARRVDVVVEDSLTFPTTGSADIPRYKATGNVTFFNILQQPYRVPRNTVVRASATGSVVRFVTQSDVEVPPGGQANAPIEAVDDGSTGNVPANTINVVEGVPSIAVRVINLGPTSGGGGDTVRAVTTDDIRSARATLRATLLDRALGAMRAAPEVVDNGLYVVPDTLFIAEVQDEGGDRFAGEQAAEVTVNTRLQIAGLAVAPGDLDAIARTELASKTPRGFDLLDVRVQPGDAAEEGVGFGAQPMYFMTARGTAGTRIEAADVRRLVRGKPVAEAQRTLTQAYSLNAPPKIEVSPEALARLLNRVPFVPARISVSVERE